LNLCYWGKNFNRKDNPKEEPLGSTFYSKGKENKENGIIGRTSKRNDQIKREETKFIPRRLSNQKE